LSQGDLGFDPGRIGVAPVAFPKGQYATEAQRNRFARLARERVAALPGVLAAADAASWPPPFSDLRSPLEIAGVSDPSREPAIVRMVSEDFLRVLGMSIVAGRGLTEDDVERERRVALVNHALATRFFSDRDPLGRFITLPALRQVSEPVADPTFEAVAVVADVRNSGVREAAAPEVLVPSTTWAGPRRVILARTAGDPAL